MGAGERPKNLPLWRNKIINYCHCSEEEKREVYLIGRMEEKMHMLAPTLTTFIKTDGQPKEKYFHTINYTFIGYLYRMKCVLKRIVHSK